MSDDLLLSTQELSAGYRTVQVLHGINIEVAAGKIVAVIGPNGAGKTTLARALAGFALVSAGGIFLTGTCVTSWAPDRRVRHGMASIPEGRRLFPEMTVEQNLELALFSRWRELGLKRRDELMADAFARFPRLDERRLQSAGSLSGGEQQMLAIARALMLEPKLLILDEPSTGLAPIIVAQIFDALREIVATRSCGCLLIEQQAITALELADYAYILDRGRVTGSGIARQLRDDPALRDRYLGKVESEHDADQPKHDLAGN